LLLECKEFLLSFFPSKASKNICNPPVCTLKDTKIAQFWLKNEEKIG
jgi:hypothetical protein